MNGWDEDLLRGDALPDRPWLLRVHVQNVSRNHLTVRVPGQPDRRLAPQTSGFCPLELGVPCQLIYDGFIEADSSRVPYVLPSHYRYVVSTRDVLVWTNEAFDRGSRACANCLIRTVLYPLDVLSVRDQLDLPRPFPLALLVPTPHFSIVWSVIISGQASLLASFFWLVYLRVCFHWWDKVNTAEIALAQPCYGITTAFRVFVLCDLGVQALFRALRSFVPNTSAKKWWINAILAACAIVFHPLDCVGRWQVLHPELSAVEAARLIWARSGIRGFFAGVHLRCIRVLLSFWGAVSMEMGFNRYFRGKYGPIRAKQLPCPLRYHANGDLK